MNHRDHIEEARTPPFGWDPNPRPRPEPVYRDPTDRRVRAEDDYLQQLASGTTGDDPEPKK